MYVHMWVKEIVKKKITVHVNELTSDSKWLVNYGFFYYLLNVFFIEQNKNRYHYETITFPSSKQISYILDVCVCVCVCV